MLPLHPYHGRELAALCASLGRRLASADVLRAVRDLTLTLVLLGALAAGLWTLVELVPFHPPRIA